MISGKTQVLPRHRNAAEKIAHRLWVMLPRDDAERRLDQIADQIRKDSSVDLDLLDLAVETIKDNLAQLDDGRSGHA